MLKIYCISGLGADHSLFQKLSIGQYELVALPWVDYDAADDMATYAAKMAGEIPEEHAVIIGLSFGGMLATEIAKTHPSWKIFLVSSAKTAGELGYNNGSFSKLLKWISRSQLIPSVFLGRPNPVSMALLGAKTVEEKKMIREVMRHSDPNFYRWCINTILHWTNTTITPNIVHIHGTNDQVIRPAPVKPHYWIQIGSHIMIYNRAAEVSKIISDCLRS